MMTMTERYVLDEMMREYQDGHQVSPKKSRNKINTLAKLALAVGIAGCAGSCYSYNSKRVELERSRTPEVEAIESIDHKIARLQFFTIPRCDPSYVRLQQEYDTLTSNNTVKKMYEDHSQEHKRLMNNLRGSMGILSIMAALGGTFLLTGYTRGDEK